jgi:MFS family permease
MERRIILYYFKPIVWHLMIGLVFSRTASFMTLPFLAIYMYEVLDATPLVIGITVGIAQLTSTVGGFFGGYLTDLIGRKKILLSAIVGWVFVFLGFALATNVAMFIILSALNGVCRAFFEPSSQVLMIEQTPVEKRRRLFSIRYTFINLSAVIGPLIGVAISNSSSMKVPFIVTGCLYVFCFFFFMFVLRHVEDKKGQEQTLGILNLLAVLWKDRVLMLIILGSVFCSFVFSQTDSTLSQLLNYTMDEGIRLFSVLIAVNALTVMILQFPLSVMMEKVSIKLNLLIGSILLIIGMFCFYLADSWSFYILAMVIISFAEIFIIPMMNVVVEMIAPSHQKATYLGVMQFQSLGGFLGPIIGGWMITHFISEVYLVMVFIAAFMLVCYERALKSTKRIN